MQPKLQTSIAVTQLMTAHEQVRGYEHCVKGLMHMQNTRESKQAITWLLE